MVEQAPAESGSQKWLQIAVNHNSNLFNSLIARQLHPTPSRIKWLSPLEDDAFKEYRIKKFITRLGLELRSRPLNTFWPTSGPRWDGLAMTDNSQAILVEAKAHINEMNRPGTGAKNCDSLDTICRSLKETQKFLASDQSVDWSKGPFYQYANRIAHLYFLTELNGIDAYLLMVYFLDYAVSKGPKCVEDWKAAILNQHRAMGLAQNHRLECRIIDLYLSVKLLGE